MDSPRLQPFAPPADTHVPPGRLSLAIYALAWRNYAKFSHTAGPDPFHAQPMGVGVAKRLLRGRGILSFPGVFGLASVLAWFQCGLGFGLVWFAARNLITFFAAFIHNEGAGFTMDNYLLFLLLLWQFEFSDRLTNAWGHIIGKLMLF